MPRGEQQAKAEDDAHDALRDRAEESLLEEPAPITLEPEPRIIGATFDPA